MHLLISYFTLFFISFFQFPPAPAGGLLSGAPCGNHEIPDGGLGQERPGGVMTRRRESGNPGIYSIRHGPEKRNGRGEQRNRAFLKPSPLLLSEIPL